MEHQFDCPDNDTTEEAYTPIVSYDLADSLRCSKRVLFEKVARRPKEYLTVLTGFNRDLLIAFAWECCPFLDENDYHWFKYQQVEDDCFDQVVSFHELNVLLRNLFTKTEAEIYYLEWNVHVTVSWRCVQAKGE